MSDDLVRFGDVAAVVPPAVATVPLTHLRFIGGTVYCPIARRRVQTGQPYGRAYTCPACGYEWHPESRR